MKLTENTSRFQKDRYHVPNREGNQFYGIFGYFDLVECFWLDNDVNIAMHCEKMQSMFNSCWSEIW